MNTLELGASSDEFFPCTRPLFRCARGVLLLVLGIIYAGFVPFFITVSPALLNSLYLVIGGCLAVCLIFDWSASRNAESVAPYLLFTFGYFLWGMMASADGAVVREGLKTCLKNFLVIGALAITLERRTLKTFAQLVQLAVLGNFALCVWESFDPSLVAEIAHTREEGATAFNVLRPAGLWSNPDEAASAFIFALLMTRWAGRTLGWPGGVAAVIGIYLGASRTGAYLLALCGLFYAGHWLKQHRTDSARLASWFVALLLVGLVGAVVATKSGLDLSAHWQLARILDLTESTRDPGDATRVEIASNAIGTALDGPWYGHGLFTFQSEATLPTAIDIPAHNVFLVVWGEAGGFVAGAYLFVLGLGLWRVLKTPMLSRDRVAMLLMWVCYAIIGLTWHNQFTSFSGMLYVALLWRLPAVLEVPSQTSREHRPNPALA